MAEEFRVLRPFEFHSQLINKGKRADGRLLDEFRDIKLETDAIVTANASSLVKLGNTSLVCGCTTRSLEKKDSSYTNGINIKLELPPICSSPTGHQTQHSEQLLTKTLRNILEDTDCLALDEGENNSLSIEVDVICLNHDGCLLDAALIAILAALKTLRSKDRNIVLNSLPICSSFALIGDRFICDPNLEEETVAQSTFSITVDPSAKSDKFHLKKTGGRAINISRLTTCIQKAKDRAVHVQKYLSECRLIEDGAGMDCD